MAGTITVIGLSDRWHIPARNAGLTDDKYSFTASNWQGTVEQVSALRAVVAAEPNSGSRTIALRKIDWALLCGAGK